MYCPSCGLEHLEARRFCNRCGTNLELISRALTGTPSDPTIGQKLEQRQKAMSRAFLTIGSGVGVAIFMMIVSEILRSLRSYDAAHVVENVAMFGPLIMVIGLMLMINARILYGSKKELLRQAQHPPQLLPESPARPVQQTLPISAASSLTPPSVSAERRR